MPTRWMVVTLLIFLAVGQEYAFQNAAEIRDERAAIESAQRDGENGQKDKQAAPPAQNPFDFQRADYQAKGARIDGPYGDPRKKDPSMLHYNGKMMRSRKEYSAQRRQRAQYDANMTNGQNWFYSILSSNVTHLLIGIFVLGILAKICIKRVSKRADIRKKIRDYDGQNVIKFSNSCFEENSGIDDVQIRIEEGDGLPKHIEE